MTLKDLLQQSKMERYEAALAKVNEAFNSITTYRREVSNLVPKHQGALSVVREHVQFVEVQREEYISVSWSFTQLLNGMNVIMCVTIQGPSIPSEVGSTIFEKGGP